MQWASLRPDSDKPLRRRLALYRRVLLDKDRLLSSRLGLYSAETTTAEFFNGVITSSHDAVFDAFLHSSPLDPSFISFLKYRPDADNSSPAASSWVYRRHIFSHFQFHVVLFEYTLEDGSGGNVYVFSHNEYNWIRHPLKHFYRRHVSPDPESRTLKDILDDVPVEFVPKDKLHTDGDPEVVDYINRGERP